MLVKLFLLGNLVALVAVPAVVRANDSSALLEAGGIVITKSTDVTMESEDLWISRKLVRVSYVFRNMGSSDMKTEVAFPVPGLPTCAEEGMGECDGDMQIGDLANPMRFKLTVDGKQRSFKTEKKVEMNGSTGTTWITHHWEQIFPKDRPVRISHEYVPVAGGFFTDTSGFSKGRFERDMSELYCVGPKLLAALKRQEQFVWAVHYILTTGANWKGPIKTFKLTIAKESPKDKISVCIPDTRRVSATTFEVARQNFVPMQDLKILFIPGDQ